MKNKIWYDDKSMVNIFSFANMADQYLIQYDNKIDDAFWVNINGKTVKFKRSEEGLYYYNMPLAYVNNMKHEYNNEDIQMVTMVNKNLSNYSD